MNKKNCIKKVIISMYFILINIFLNKFERINYIIIC